MKYFTFICLILIAGCKVSDKAPSQPTTPVSDYRRVVINIDTIVGVQCLYKTASYLDSIYVSEGSIITRCGCFFIDEEVNHDCITQTPVHPLAR